MHIKERIRRLRIRVERGIFGPSPEDSDFPDPRPENQARDRFEAAERMKGVETKEEVMSMLSEAVMGSWTDYDYRAGYYRELKRMAWERAEDLGVNRDEIKKVVQDANVSGATARQGFRDYFL
jgi:uncharacterized protein YjiS (DUF1127 family)